MDVQYINDLRALEDKKEAKALLIEYAEKSGIKVKKSKGFDALVLEIEEGFKALASEPMPEVNEGLSISDLIDADEELQGNFTHDDAKEEAIMLFDAPTTDKIEIIEQPVAPVFDKVEVQVQVPEVELRKPQARVIQEPEDVPVEEKFKAPSESFELPEGFSPNLLMMGKTPGYCTLPWWIYQWISETPDWKSRPTSFPHGSAHQTLFSLIYYINRNGSVLVRETRNSSFITLD